MFSLFAIALLTACAKSAMLSKTDQRFHGGLQLAHITPLDIFGNEDRRSAFRGYIRLSNQRPSTYGFYELLCPIPTTYGISLHKYFHALDQKLNELRATVEKVSRKGVDQTEEFSYQEPKGSGFSEANNLNAQSDIFQCGGFTCPSNATRCTIVVNSLPPHNLMVREGVYCLNENDEILDDFNQIVRNETPGSSVNISKTFNRNENLVNFDEEFARRQEEMRQRQDQMKQQLAEAQNKREEQLKIMQEKMKQVFGRNGGWSEF